MPIPSSSAAFDAKAFDIDAFDTDIGRVSSVASVGLGGRRAGATTSGGTRMTGRPTGSTTIKATTI